MKFYIKDNMCTPYKLVLHRVQNFLTVNGWVHEPDEDKAEYAIVGCCGAFKSLSEEAVEFIKEAKLAGRKILTYGCLTTIEPELINSFNPDVVINAYNWLDFEKLINKPRVLLNEIPLTNEFRSKEEYRLYNPKKKFILIQTGCSSNCPYCPHKLGIGNLESRPLEEITKQLKECESNDVDTVILHGNDTGSYGTDIGTTFPELVKKALEFKLNLHLTQINADWAYKYKDLLFPLLKDKKIKDFQVLIQTTSNRILKIMRRAPVVNNLKDYFKNIKKERKDLFLRTDIIIGFPTATLEEEKETLKYVAEIFDEVAIHGFERFQHTEIEKMGFDFYEQSEVDKRVDIAIRYLESFGNILIHRGGQVYETLINVEQPKEMMRVEKVSEIFK